MLNFINIFFLGECELYDLAFVPVIFQAFSNACSGTQNTFSAKPGGSPESAFLSHYLHTQAIQEKYLFRDASGGDAAKLLQYSSLLSSQELFP